MLEGETHTNERGGKQSFIDVAYVLIPAYAMEQIAKVLFQGAQKYGVDNWKQIPTMDHVNHAMRHIFKWLANDRQEPHLVNAACRIIFAIVTDKEENKGE